MPTLEDVLAELAAAPPSEFTRARDALVARLTKLGQAEAAARVKAVRRPTAALWAANRVAREDREGIQRLVAAADHMRAAQLGQGATGADFATASAEQRAALTHLTQRTEALLKQAGLGATHQVLLRVETTLAGAAADPELRPALRQGRLEHELAARGFDVFAGEELPARRPAAPTAGGSAGIGSPAPSSGSKADRERDESRLTDAREAVAEAEARATQQREAVASARLRVEELSAMLRDAQRRETEAAREGKRAEAALRAAREALRAAERK